MIFKKRYQQTQKNAKNQTCTVNQKNKTEQQNKQNNKKTRHSKRKSQGRHLWRLWQLNGTPGGAAAFFLSHKWPRVFVMFWKKRSCFMFFVGILLENLFVKLRYPKSLVPMLLPPVSGSMLSCSCCKLKPFHLLNPSWPAQKSGYISPLGRTSRTW